jgi:hypothetical protein
MRQTVPTCLLPVLMRFGADRQLVKSK